MQQKRLWQTITDVSYWMMFAFSSKMTSNEQGVLRLPSCVCLRRHMVGGGHHHLPSHESEVELLYRYSDEQAYPPPSKQLDGTRMVTPEWFWELSFWSDLNRWVYLAVQKRPEWVCKFPFWCDHSGRTQIWHILKLPRNVTMPSPYYSLPPSPGRSHFYPNGNDRGVE